MINSAILIAELRVDPKRKDKIIGTLMTLGYLSSVVSPYIAAIAQPLPSIFILTMCIVAFTTNFFLPGPRGD